MTFAFDNLLVVELVLRDISSSVGSFLAAFLFVGVHSLLTVNPVIETLEFSRVYPTIMAAISEELKAETVLSDKQVTSASHSSDEDPESPPVMDWTYEEESKAKRKYVWPPIPFIPVSLDGTA